MVEALSLDRYIHGGNYEGHSALAYCALGGAHGDCAQCAHHMSAVSGFWLFEPSLIFVPCVHLAARSAPKAVARHPRGLKRELVHVYAGGDFLAGDRALDHDGCHFILLS